MDEDILKKILNEINTMNERLRAIEKEQRLIREDILSGEADLRMRKRILEKPRKNNKNKKEIDEKIDIKI